MVVYRAGRLKNQNADDGGTAVTSLVKGLEPSPRRKRYLLSGPGTDERSQSSQRVTKPLMSCRASGRVIVFAGASPL